MTKCTQCNIYLRDNSQVCPLCRCVVTADTNAADSYPDIRLYDRRLKRIANICLFGLIMASVVLLILNYVFFHGLFWSLIPVGAMCYGYLLIRYVLLSSHGYRPKALIWSLATILLVILIDMVTGLHRWSLNYVFPCVLIGVDGMIVALMVINRRNWQSYILLQLGMILIGLIPLLFWHWGWITKPLLSIIAMGISTFLFLGTLIIGDRPARVELRRRFHI